MVTSTRSPKNELYNLEIEQFQEFLIKNKVKNPEKLIKFYTDMVKIITQKYPNLEQEFEQALQQTLLMTLSGVVIDNSIVVSPLSWFANKYNYDDLLEACNQISLQLFDIQEGIEF
jgi:hypothetical protein